MRILGKERSKWWLVVVPLLILLCSPLLLMLFFAANDFAGAIVGPPVIWNRPWHTPTHLDLVGRYSESERRAGSETPSGAASLTLRSDGSLTVDDLPEELGKSSCLLSGGGRWSGPDADDRVTLDFVSNGRPGTCDSGSYAFIEIAGQSKPYSLYVVLGDPDSGTGIWLKRAD